MTRYVTCAETAKLVREALKANFPGVPFSVKSKTYSGGASITVKWTDGPAPTDVEKVTSQFEGADFDGMVDLKSPVVHEVNGEKVHFGADYIFTDRVLSDTFLVKAAALVYERYGKKVKFIIGPHGTEIAHEHLNEETRTSYTMAELVYQTSRQMSL
jgi:hypothetical protein